MTQIAFSQDVLEDIDKENPLYFALAYQQSELMLVDPVGDMQILYLKSKGANKKLMAMLFGNMSKVIADANKNEKIARALYPEMSSLLDDSLEYGEPEKKGPVIEGRQNPIKSNEIIKMFKQIITQENNKGIKAKVGEFHKWSREYKKENRKTISIWQGSKLFLTLAAGTTSRFLVTGGEDDLINWILRQENNSIEIHEIFRRSYQIHNGNIYLSLLGIENVLSRYWKVKNRGNLLLTKKLTSITNHFEGRGDKFGAWYHFFGMMTFGYATKSAFKSSAVGRIESFGSFITSKLRREFQEKWINKKAGPIGAKLRKAVESGKAMNFVEKINYLDSSKYLDLTETY